MPSRGFFFVPRSVLAFVVRIRAFF